MSILRFANRTIPFTVFAIAPPFRAAPGEPVLGTREMVTKTEPDPEIWPFAFWTPIRTAGLIAALTETSAGWVRNTICVGGGVTPVRR